MSKVTPIRELRRATKTVICPACQEKGETFRVSEPFTTQQKASLAAASVVTAGIPLVFYLNGPRANWLAHYCHTCGIRLTTYVQEGGPVFPLNSSMLEVPRDSLTSPSTSRTNLPARLARSPLGPPLKVDFRSLSSFADRHRSLFPDLILDVDWNKYLDMPVSLRTLDRHARTYEVRFPDFDLDGKLNAVMFWPSKRDPHFFCPLIWTPERANLRVVGPAADRDSREVGLVQLAQAEWDVGMYFPKRGADGGEVGGYDFRHQEVGANHFVFARNHPHFVWSSAEGPLLWTVQRAADGLCEGQGAEDRLILLDCYDRLIAMEHCKFDARWREWDSVPRDHVFESHLNLRFYGALPAKMVDEIVVSYVAVSAQMRRKGEWDFVNIETD
ncbi:hypothetical protein CONLIGDRAFT_640226 [Coniochaeta ligniaria NRRL 30616]|uniref:LITAF domain-containing protein n=1 Tax=Coniochaeta ligniaria NRRL 30616 TaxID=1408157 RepID=A0A1J7J107_9PEZI|nr:hypothetical protein CONLIGDRAFT_640226 [Coniochaeta ligniaria NRRL 30616]